MLTSWPVLREALKWFEEKQIYSFPTPHTRSAGNKGVPESHSLDFGCWMAC